MSKKKDTDVEMLDEVQSLIASERTFHGNNELEEAWEIIEKVKDNLEKKIEEVTS
jgi:hypothetical protein